MDTPAPAPRPRQPAFTLVELLVSIGIIAVLLALALPALSGARKRARDAAGLSNMRQTGLAMENYVQRYNGWLPWAPEGTPFLLSPPDHSTGSVSSNYWDLSSYWSSLFFEVAPWEEWFGLWCFPDPRRSTEHPWQSDPGVESPLGNGRTSLQYSRALFAAPELWSPGPMIEDRGSVMRAVRASEVRYPSGKVSLYDAELGLRERLDNPMTAKRAMLFLDAHASMKALGDAIAPAPPRLPWFGGHASPIHDTAGGAYGRDY